MARRSRKDIVIDRIEKLGNDIADVKNRLSQLENEKDKLEKELSEIEAHEKKIAQEQSLARIAKMVKEKNMSLEDIEKYLLSK